MDANGRTPPPAVTGHGIFEEWQLSSVQGNPQNVPTRLAAVLCQNRMLEQRNQTLSQTVNGLRERVHPAHDACLRSASTLLQRIKSLTGELTFERNRLCQTWQCNESLTERNQFLQQEVNRLENELAWVKHNPLSKQLEEKKRQLRLQTQMNQKIETKHEKTKRLLKSREKELEMLQYDYNQLKNGMQSSLDCDDFLIKELFDDSLFLDSTSSISNLSSSLPGT